MALLAAAGAWAAVYGFEWAGPRSEEREAAKPRPAARIAKAVAARDEAMPSRAEDAPVPAPEIQLAARLSLELSRLPEPLPEPETRPAVDSAIPSARLTAKAPGEANVAPARSAAIATTRPEAKRAEEIVARGEPGALPAADPGAIDKRLRQPTVQQLAEGEYRKATALLHQGRINEAQQGFAAALSRYPGHHSARQALLGVLVGTKQNAEAERVMQEGLQLAPHQIGFAMALARLQVDRGDSPAAIAALQKSAGYAQESGDYLAFLGGLLQRQQRNAEAIEQFEAALRVKPNHGLWLLGLGMSLEDLGRDAEAREAFQRATVSGTLSADLQALAESRFRRLQ
ncbi:MAG: tetratricopeptide repeat protein [Betaproteobacteria bacterium]|nr:tetratricopeptide repeat protein [Betaproteobacteria bacterium]